MVEHKRSVNSKEERSLIYKNTVETRVHKFNFDEVEVLATIKWENPRKMIEALHTKRSNDSINKA